MQQFLFRSDDPETSKSAAQKATTSGMVKSHEELILQALNKPRTASEIGRIVNIDYVAVNRRIASMRRKGLVRTTDKTRKNPNGNSERVHEKV